MAKKKRVMTDEHKAKLAAGREAAKLRKVNQALNDAPVPKENRHGLNEAGEAISTDGAPQPRLSMAFPEAPIDATTLLLQKLMAEIEELKKTRNPEMTPEAALHYTAQMQGVSTQPTIGKNGIQGKMFRYPVEPGYYPNPIERLYDEPTLKRFGLRDNYFFDWQVEGVEYEKYGITYAEPKFTVRLFRRIFEDDGVTPSGQFALINRQIQHEDEVVARAAADKLGITEEFADFKDMMNEVRFLRIRQWLVELFTPPKVETHKNKPTQQVIGGKVVEVFDTESLIDGESGISKAAGISREVRI